MNKQTMGTDEMSAHRNTEVKSRKGKLNILHHLALQRSKDSAFDKVDELNEFMDKLIQSLGDKASEWKPVTQTPTTKVTTAGPRGKRDVISARSLFQQKPQSRSEAGASPTEFPQHCILLVPPFAMVFNGAEGLVDAMKKQNDHLSS